MERSALRTQNATICFMVNFNVSVYYCVLTRAFVKRQLKSWQRQLEKTAVVKAGAYIVSIVAISN